MKKFIYLIISVINAGIMALYLSLSPVNTIPMHLNFSGDIDRYSSKWELLGIMCILVVFGLIYAIVEAFRKYMGLKSDNKKYADKIIAAIFVFLLIMFWFMSILIIHNTVSANINTSTNSALGIIDIFPSTLIALLGVSIVFISNILPKIKQNDAFGIRTRATTSSEYVWKKTHRLGAYTGVFGGLAMIICGIIGYAVKNSGMVMLYVGIGIMLISLVIIPAIYAQILYRRELKDFK